MATFFRNVVAKDIGPTAREVIETSDNSRVTVIGMSLANTTEFVVLADVAVQNDTSTEAYFCKGLIIPPNSTARIVNGGEKLILTSSNVLKINSNVEDSIDAVISFVEIV
jgi:hypothetical protein